MTHPKPSYAENSLPPLVIIPPPQATGLPFALRLWGFGMEQIMQLLPRLQACQA